MAATQLRGETGDCPKVFPAQTQCATGHDAHGSFYLLALPPKWNETLVVYDHGGPSVVFNGLGAALGQASNQKLTTKVGDRL